MLFPQRVAEQLKAFQGEVLLVHFLLGYRMWLVRFVLTVCSEVPQPHQILLVFSVFFDFWLTSPAMEDLGEKTTAAVEVSQEVQRSYWLCLHEELTGG
jgi:hypothetical protein